MKQTCFCREGFVTRNGVEVRHESHIPHDCAYITERNKLLPEAEQFARNVLTSEGIKESNIAYGNQFTALLSRTMDELWAKREMLLDIQLNTIKDPTTALKMIKTFNLTPAEKQKVLAKIQQMSK